MTSEQQWRRLYPFASRWIEMEGYRYHYVDEGAGDVLLMVHGNPTWSFYWRNLVNAWSYTYRIIAPDHIGCGLSDKPTRYPYSLSQHTQNLLQLIDRLDLRNVTLLAHDWGGAIGLGAALARPERFARFVLFNTGAFPPPRVPRRIAVCRTPLLGRFALQGMNLFSRAALRMATNKPGRITSEVRAGILAPYDNWAHRVAIYQFVKDIPLTRRHPTYRRLEDIEHGLPTLCPRPIQFIWGMRDWCFTPACLQRFLQIFPDADVHRLDDAGHWVVEDAHERIVGLVERFFDRHPLEGRVSQDMAASTSDE